jgi:hypothetical protein
MREADPVSDAAAMRAVADWYHAAFTGVLLAAVVRLGTPVAADLVFRVFDRQREARFLPGLAKLGLDRLPHAVAAASYHYLSNDVGGVAVQFMPESERKAWVRYVPPRWIWAGTALCAIPDELTVAMLRGWHARNGVSLGNPRLGFVCTKTTTAGDAALEGYYLEYDHELAPDERLRFARDEDGPAFDPARAPALSSASWPAQRLAKAHRNYAMEYLRTLLPVAFEALGDDTAAKVLGLALKQVGLQHAHEAAHTLGLAPPTGAQAFADFLTTMARGQGDPATLHVDGDRRVVVQQGLRLLDGTGAAAEIPVRTWARLWEGALASFDPRLVMSTDCSVDAGRVTVTWTIGPAR